eukprot:526042_1
MTRGRSNSRKRAALQRKQIEAAILSEPIDIEVLRSLARSGLADNRLRRIVWPYLLGCTDNIIQNDMKHGSWTNILHSYKTIWTNTQIESKFERISKGRYIST